MDGSSILAWKVTLETLKESKSLLPASRWLNACSILLPAKWRLHVLPKRQLFLHCTTRCCITQSNSSKYQVIYSLSISLRTAAVAWWSGLLITDSEVQVRFPALQDFLRSRGSWTRSTLPSEYNEGATWKESSDSGLEKRDYGRRGSAALTTGQPSISKSWHKLRRQVRVARPAQFATGLRLVLVYR
jgi:hypothetical protein